MDTPVGTTKITTKISHIKAGVKRFGAAKPIRRVQPVTSQLYVPDTSVNEGMVGALLGNNGALSGSDNSSNQSGGIRRGLHLGFKGLSKHPAAPAMDDVDRSAIKVLMEANAGFQSHRSAEPSPYSDVDVERDLHRQYGLDPDLRLNLNDSNIRPWSWVPQTIQAFALSRREHEIYYGGARFGGKSECQRAFMVRMAIERLNGLIRYPNYKGLVLRVSYEELKSWIKEAHEMYAVLGGRPHGKPVEFSFRGGPIIATGHLDGVDGFSKYLGHQWHKIGLDEANKIPTEEHYLPLLGSNRMSPDGISQVFATGNPGFVGDIWIKPYWIYVYSNGVQVPWKTPFRDPVSGKTRIFIPSKPSDNPIGLQKDPHFMGSLLAQSAARQKQWIHGDWNVQESPIFDWYRSERSPAEPPQAVHAIHSSTVELLPRYRRWISCDWGYGDLTVVLWHCQHDDGRVYTYREMVLKKVGAKEIGAKIAELTYDELAALPESRMEMYLSPDAFSHKDETNTIDDRIRQGMEMVFGFGTVVSLSMNDEEYEIAQSNAGEANRRYIHRIIGAIGRGNITIRAANDRRPQGIAYMNELMRWQPISTAPVIQEVMQKIQGLDPIAAAKIIHKYNSQYAAEMVLPKWRIFSDKCPLTTKTLPVCQKDPAKPEDMLKFAGDDCIDSLRYGLFAVSDMPAEMPAEYTVMRLIEQYKNTCHQSGRTVDVNMMRAMWLKGDDDKKRKLLRKATDFGVTMDEYGNTFADEEAVYRMQEAQMKAQESELLSGSDSLMAVQADYAVDEEAYR